MSHRCKGTEELDQLTLAERSLWTAHHLVQYVDINWVEGTLTSAGMRVTRKVRTLLKSVSSKEEAPILTIVGSRRDWGEIDKKHLPSRRRSRGTLSS